MRDMNLYFTNPHKCFVGRINVGNAIQQSHKSCDTYSQDEALQVIHEEST